MKRDWKEVLTREECITVNVHEHGCNRDLVLCIERLSTRILELEDQPTVVVAGHIDTIEM